MKVWWEQGCYLPMLQKICTSCESLKGQLVFGWSHLAKTFTPVLMIYVMSENSSTEKFNTYQCSKRYIPSLTAHFFWSTPSRVSRQGKCFFSCQCRFWSVTDPRESCQEGHSRSYRDMQNSYPTHMERMHLHLLAFCQEVNSGRKLQ